MQGCLSSYAHIWKRAPAVMTTPPADLSAERLQGDGMAAAPVGGRVVNPGKPGL
jgi:hypothetical protein